MAEVTGITYAAAVALADAGVVSGAVDGSGHLILTTRGGSTIDAGAVVGSPPAASTSTAGIVELATDAEALAGTDLARAVTPHGVAQVAALYQPLDADLTAIAGLAPADGDMITRISGVWANRTATQVAAALAAVGTFLQSNLYSGSAYSAASGAQVYVGTTDPGSVPNGSVWFDTT